MCTLIVAWQVFPDAPVVAAANRDEADERPSRPPERTDGDPAVVAPRDEEAGGTWLGYNEYGVLAAVTNRWTDADLAGERSRGLLVDDALAHETAEDAARFVERAVERHEYEGFYLLVADANAAIVAGWDGRLTVRNFEPGVHVVMNVGVDDTFTIPTARPEAGERQMEAARRIRTALRPEPGEEVGAWLDRATDLLADHEYGVCVHGDGFGTRSSSLVTLRADGTAEYRFADGPPCRTPYETVDAEP